LLAFYAGFYYGDDALLLSKPIFIKVNMLFRMKMAVSKHDHIPCCDCIFCGLRLCSPGVGEKALRDETLCAKTGPSPISLS
jgi:hypothetical protein